MIQQKKINILWPFFKGGWEEGSAKVVNINLLSGFLLMTVWKEGDTYTFANHAIKIFIKVQWTSRELLSDIFMIDYDIY